MAPSRENPAFPAPWLKPGRRGVELSNMSPGTHARINRSVTADKKAVLLWISDVPMPPNVVDAVLGHYQLKALSPDESVTTAAEGACVALIYPGGPRLDVRRISSLLDELDRTSLVGLVLMPSEGSPISQLIRRNGQFAITSVDSSPQTIAGQISALMQVQPSIDILRQELTQLRSFGHDIGATFDQIDEEMRLAARLQRDFLPRHLPSVGPLRFGVLFRPATWVSGDIYDATRLDERHLGFYVADAVGHGLPAALLTMFIKRALPTKRIVGQQYNIVPPNEAIAELNAAICEQNLSSCQFCTAVYCVANTQTLEVTYARGGHPQPLLLRADGSMLELDSEGGLLGIFAEERFSLGQVQLAPGDRLIVHSDGAEGVFRREGTSGREELLAAIERLRHRPLDEMMMELTGLIDSQQGSLHPEDDVTILALDVTR